MNRILILAPLMIGCASHLRSSSPHFEEENGCLSSDLAAKRDELIALRKECREEQFSFLEPLVWEEMHSPKAQKEFLEKTCKINLKGSVLFNVEAFEKCERKFYRAFIGRLRERYSRVDWSEVNDFAASHPDVYADPEDFEMMVMWFQNREERNFCAKKRFEIIDSLNDGCEKNLKVEGLEFVVEK